MARIQVEANQCDVCGHIWLSTNPLRCAKCKSPYWDRGARVTPPEAMKPVFEEVQAARQRWEELSREMGDNDSGSLVVDVPVTVKMCPTHKTALMLCKPGCRR